MNYDIIPTPDFERAFKALSKRHRSLKQDLIDFSKSLQENPFQGDELTPGIRKIRMSIKSKGRGKSGGARVITYTLVVNESMGRIYLIDIYDKADFSTVDVALIQKIVKDLGL
ncbi:MAG: addiction module toxin RelE [Muribaculaceae bacterium]|nr:addiction module toxin RelE [Muribaculaceae bacterium]